MLSSIEYTLLRGLWHLFMMEVILHSAYEIGDLTNQGVFNTTSRQVLDLHVLLDHSGDTRKAEVVTFAWHVGSNSINYFFIACEISWPGMLLQFLWLWEKEAKEWWRDRSTPFWPGEYFQLILQAHCILDLGWRGTVSLQSLPISFSSPHFLMMKQILNDIGQVVSGW